MPTEWLAIALVALIVGSSTARRAGEHADRRAGPRSTSQKSRRGPLGATADLVDSSVAMYAARSRLGWSTTTRAERRAEVDRAVAVAQAVAQAEAIRRQRIGLSPAKPPTYLVVSGSASSRQTGAVSRHTAGARRPSIPAIADGQRASTTLRIELAAAALALVVVVGIVVAVWPREQGAVLSATGAPTVPSSPPTPIPTITLMPSS